MAAEHETALRRFLVVGPPRSGTTLLAERLNSHPAVTCYGEVLQPTGPVWAPAPRPPAPPPDDLARTDPGRFLEEGVWRHRPPGVRAVGAKLVFVQAGHARDGLTAYLRDLDAADIPGVIWTRRENLLAQYVSQRVAERTRIWTLDDPAQRPEVPPLEVDGDDLDSFFRTAELQRLAVARIFEGCPGIETTYERLTGDPVGEAARLCDFLGVPAVPLAGRSVRMRTRPLSEAVANFDALAARFRGGPFAAFFEDAAG